MWKIKPSVQCSDEWPPEPPKQRYVDPIQVAMDDIEIVCATSHALEQGGERRNRIDRRPA
ncbi:MAG TPA: hypothetical protein VKB78_09280 [Pirellulales bacterium]|nr:hypothetical protein [Pirellulales bacterium]